MHVCRDLAGATLNQIQRVAKDLQHVHTLRPHPCLDRNTPKNDEDWSNAVHSCRRILQDAADALYPVRADKVVKVGDKDQAIKLGVDNYINRLMAYVEENSSSGRFEEIVGSHIRFLGERLDSIFQAAQKGSHDIIATREEAYLVTWDILDLKAEVDATTNKASD